MTIEVLVVLAVLVEALTGVIKSILLSFGVPLRDWVDQLISLVVALVVAAAGKVDFFAVLSQVLPVELRLPWYLGVLFSAVVLSRGSNAVHDLLKKLNPPQEGAARMW